MYPCTIRTDYDSHLRPPLSYSQNPSIFTPSVMTPSWLLHLQKSSILSISTCTPPIVDHPVRDQYQVPTPNDVNFITFVKRSPLKTSCIRNHKTLRLSHSQHKTSPFTFRPDLYTWNVLSREVTPVSRSSLHIFPTMVKGTEIGRTSDSRYRIILKILLRVSIKLVLSSYLGSP